MFFEFPIQESDSKFPVTNEMNEDLWGNPTSAGMRTLKSNVGILNWKLGEFNFGAYQSVTCITTDYCTDGNNNIGSGACDTWRN